MPRHECAQRAAAQLIAERRGADPRAVFASLRATHPPDTPFRLLGTTPRALARMLDDAGVPARLLTRASAEDMRPDALACVDLRPLVGGLPRLHWVRIEEASAEGVRAEGRWHAWPRWMRAWTCRVSPFPMHRRALVVPLP